MIPAGILMLMFAFGLGLFFGTVNVFVRDVGQMRLCLNVQDLVCAQRDQ
jgi:ABC-type polysaccharide/polyol phosphate export permease